ncbi:glycosyltransferase [Halobacillus litoralis]|uniref:glycosyltransferase n=1 Tax=Halobacillus litoralis TaxID=45668 RepID=UPI001CD61758|nr:glycosyltransferase [Halobacillus litoralis]MCA0970932.1 glycosyltransferase [Halobacillus litoralis]
MIKLNILILSHMYPSSLFETNGVFVHEQVKELQKQGHNVVVVSPTPLAPSIIKTFNSKWKRYSELPFFESFEGINIYRPRYIQLPKLILENYSGDLMYFGIKKFVGRIINEYSINIIHAHVAMPDGVTARKISRIYNIPYFVTIHGKDFASTIQRERNFQPLNQTFKDAKGIFLVSNKLDYLRKKYFKDIDDEKFHVIHNGVNERFLENDFLEENTDKFVILSVSNLIHTKGIDTNLLALAELASKYPNVEYQIIGDGPEKERLKELVDNLNLGNNVKFIGRKSNFEVKSYMERCNVFSLPSWSEAFGVVYIEAMACGKPVIGCLGQGVEDIVSNNYEGFLINPNDHQKLSGIFMKLLNKPALAKSMGNKGKSIVMSNFTWGKNVEKTIGAFSKDSNDAQN